MRRLLCLFCLCTLLAAAAVSVQAASVYFDVANCGNGLTSLAPNYANGANALVSVTPLAAHGVSPSYDSDLGSPGDFIFTGWPSTGVGVMLPDRYIGFSITAAESVSLRSLKYTAFGGIWSNMGGPHFIWVKASRDGFASDETDVRYFRQGELALTLPYITDSPNDFVDDLNGLGNLNAGQTMTFRFYIGWADYGQIPGGFWNKSVNDYNPTIEFVAVPEPSSLFAVLTGIGGLGGLIRRRRR